MAGDLIPPHTYTSGDLLTAASLNDFLLEAKIKDEVVKFSHFTKEALEQLEDFFNKRRYKVGDIIVTKSEENPSVKFGGTWKRIDDKMLYAGTGDDGLISIKSSTFAAPDWSKAKAMESTNYTFEADGWFSLVYQAEFWHRLYLNEQIIGWAYARGTDYGSVMCNMIPVSKGDKLSGNATSLAGSMFVPLKAVNKTDIPYRKLFLWEKVSDENDSSVS